MKASLPNKEPEILKKWEKYKIFEKLRKNSKGKENLFYTMAPICEWPYTHGNCS